MHTSKDDYLINTLRFVSAKEETQIYGAILPDSLTSPEMKETKVYKTYIGFASGATPPKKARKFKKPTFPKLTTVGVSTEEPTGKSKRVKRPAKKTTKAPARGIVIQETPEIPVSKKKEKVDVTRGKGIELLSHVALNEDAQFEEVRRKSMRDFHKTHPSGSGAVKIIPLVTSEGTGVKSGVPDQENDSDDNKTLSDDENESDSDHETEENKLGSKSDHEGNEEDENDEEEAKDKLVKTPSNDSDDEDETKITDKAEGDEDEEMDYTTIIEDAHVTLSTIPQNTEVPITSSSHSSDLAAKFLNFLDIPHTDAEVVSPMDVHIHHEVPSQQTPKLLTVHVSVISDSSPVFSIVIPQYLPSFTPPLQQSTSTLPPTTEATNPLSTLLDFASVFQFNNTVTTLEKEC
ncbi:hypothetical protein Tco_0785247 [Tanacetum coccineum]